MQALGHDGLNSLLVAYEDKSAQAICTFAYSEGPGHEPIVFQGRTTVRPPASATGQLLRLTDRYVLGVLGQDSACSRTDRLWYVWIKHHPSSLAASPSGCALTYAQAGIPSSSSKARPTLRWIRWRRTKSLIASRRWRNSSSGSSPTTSFRGRMPGLIGRDHSEVSGWCCFQLPIQLSIRSTFSSMSSASPLCSSTTISASYDSRASDSRTSMISESRFSCSFASA